MRNNKTQDVDAQIEWIQLRSRRDPAFWVPLLLALLITTSLFVWVHDYTNNLVASVDSKGLSESQFIGELLLGVRTIAWSFGIIFILIAALNYRCFSLGARESRIPPSGLWSLGSWRAIIGPRVKIIALIGYALSVLLFITGAGVIVVVEYFLL